MRTLHPPLALKAAALLVTSLCSPPLFAGGGLDQPISREDGRAALSNVRDIVRGLASQRARPVVVFDIDDTLVEHHGKAVHGAVDFVRRLAKEGATIVYLTGRPERKRKATEESFRALGLPLGENARLMLNPGKKTLDWKKDAMGQIGAMGKPVAFFDNEKDNVRLFRAMSPYDRTGAKVFRLATKGHHPDPGGDNRHITVIKHFHHIR